MVSEPKFEASIMSGLTRDEELGEREDELVTGKKAHGQSMSRYILAALESKVVKVEMVIVDVKDRLDHMEHGMDELLGDGGLKEELREFILAMINSNLEEHRQETHVFQNMMLETVTKLQAQVEELKAGLEETKEDWALCKRVVARGTPNHVVNAGGRLETPKPKEFNGKRDAKELDNFLWHMDRYFEAVNVDERVKVNNASLYLTDLAGVWWRRKHAEIQRGMCTIDTWEILKQELKRQFYPENVAHEARKRMKELKHTRSVREYVEEFSGLMLQIPNMGDDDLLFNFMDGLQNWASQELQRRNVQDISTALTMAESLVEYNRGENSKSRNFNTNSGKNGGGKSHQSFQGNGSRPPLMGRENNNKGYKNDSRPPKSNCFICDGPHWARECPKRKALNAMLEERDAEDEQMGCMQLLNAINANPVPVEPNNTSLMYVDAEINGKIAQVMVDSGATHNFMSSNESRRLGMKL